MTRFQYLKTVSRAAALTAALLSLITIGAPPAAAQQEGQVRIDPAVLQGAPTPDLLRVVTLIKASLATVNDANLTGDYTVLRKRATPSFAEKNSPEALAETFAWWRENKIDLSPIIILKPELDQAPRLTTEGLLVAAGRFRSRPLTIEFDMIWMPIEGAWRLDGVSLRAVETQ